MQTRRSSPFRSSVTSDEWRVTCDAPSSLLTRHSPRAFTLLEVLLALSIAIGLLVVVLYFYQQASDLRTRLLQEAERISAIRLIMDRLTADLRSAYSDAATGCGLSGNAGSLSFVKTEAPSRTAWTGGYLGRAGFAMTSLKAVSYSVTTAREGTNTLITGLIRTEEPLVARRQVATTNRVTSAQVEGPAEASSSPEPLTDAIHYVRFRYYDGTGWRDSWSGPELPLGIGIALASEPPPETTRSEEAPPEIFRRVIYLPGSSAGSTAGDVSDLFEEPMSGTEAPEPTP